MSWRAGGALGNGIEPPERTEEREAGREAGGRTGGEGEEEEDLAEDEAAAEAADGLWLLGEFALFAVLWLLIFGIFIRIIEEEAEEVVTEGEEESGAERFREGEEAEDALIRVDKGKWWSNARVMNILMDKGWRKNGASD